MAHVPEDWSERIEIEDGKVWRVIKAWWRCYDIDCYKECEDGTYMTRNLYQGMYVGYCVNFPGTEGWVGNTWDTREWKKVVEPENWAFCNKKNVIYSRHPEAWDFANIEKVHPDFKYVEKKYTFRNLEEVMDILKIWREHKEVELMLAAGFKNLAMSKRLYRMTKEHQKEIMRFCRDNPTAKSLTLKEIRLCMQSEDPANMVSYLILIPYWDRVKDYFSAITFKDFMYLQKKGLDIDENYRLLSDYKSMLYNSGHNINDDYWRYPGNLRKAHDKLLAERKAKEEALRAKNWAEKSAKCQKVLKKYLKYNTKNFEGYEILMTTDMHIWEKQAEELNQCIIRAGYFDRVADRKCLIVFIQQKGKPIATAEILPNKKLGQFYGNELDRSNCKPSQEVQEVFNKWLKKVKVSEVI